MVTVFRQPVNVFPTTHVHTYTTLFFVTVKVKLSVPRSCMENGNVVPASLNFGSRGGVSGLLHIAADLPPGNERAPGTHIIGCWVDARAGWTS
jgi:hypothetical protein